MRHKSNDWYRRVALTASLLTPCLWVSGQVSAQSPSLQPVASITVDSTKVLAPVNKLVFGQSIEAAYGDGIFTPYGSRMPWALEKIRTGDGLWNPADRKVFPKVARCAREIGMSALRYPGGCLSHNFDWKKAVGPMALRGDWVFGVDEYIEACRQLNVEPQIELPEYLEPLEQLPESCAEFVEYLNAAATPEHPWAMKRKEWGHPEPYHVRWFELGNESSHGNHNVRPFVAYSPEQYANYAISTAKAIRAVDPTVKLGIVMVPSGGEDVWCDWNTTVARLAGPIADFAIIHCYSPGLGYGEVSGESIPQMQKVAEGQLMQGAMASPEQYDRYIKEYHRMISQECGRDMPLAVTEFNGAAVSDLPKPYRFSFGTALKCGDLIRVLLKPENNIALANYWQLLNGFFGMIKTNKNGDITREEPAFPIFRLWGQHFGSMLVDTQTSAPSGTFVNAGGVTRVSSTGAGSYEPRQSLGVVAIKPEWVDLTAFNSVKGITGSMDPEGTISFKLDAFRGDLNGPFITRLKRPAAVSRDTGCDYNISFEARFLPDKKDGNCGKLGLVVVDSRGWQATHSAMTILGVGSPEWSGFSSFFRDSRIDSPGIDIMLKPDTSFQTVSGIIQIRNLKIETFQKDRFPDYPLVTSSASLSEDGKTLYVIAFNKSDRDAVRTTINTRGFNAASAKRWEVNGPDMGAVDGVSEVVSGEPVATGPNTSEVVLAAHSMNAFEFSRSDAK